jgi:glucosamine-6-phosphate deaminase
MNWMVVADADELAHEAADRMLTTLRTNRRAVLGLPTGSTPEGMYAKVIEACRREYHCFSEATTFNLDEYVGIDRDHPGSYWTYMKRRLFDHVDVRPANVRIPEGTAARVLAARPDLSVEEALEIECEEYEAAIRRTPIDVTFLGLGRNGQIGFNEPGSPHDSRTRVVTLSESTRNANAPFFPAGDVPERAITMGIATILSSRSIALLAAGEAKREAVERLATGGISEDFPASALRTHPDVTIIVDEAAHG